MDTQRLASELVRALRGKRSQTALSRRLGYRTNVVYSWEAGECFPTAAKTFAIAKRIGLDLEDAISRFYGRRPEFLNNVELASREGVHAFLCDLRGLSSVQSIARSIGRDRFAVARWFKNQTEPRLPDFLKLLDACSLRLLDFVAVLADPAQVPLVAGSWRTLEAARRAARDLPWSQAVLRALELTDYKQLRKHRDGWIASRVGLTKDQETECLLLLSNAQQIRRRRGLWEVREVNTVDTRRDAEATRRLAAWCADQGSARLVEAGRGNFAFNLFSVSSADYERLRQLQREYFAQLRDIVSKSSPAERVAVVNMQLFALDDRDG